MSRHSEPPAVLVVVGASGSGKSTLVRQLDELGLAGVVCYYFDTIGVPSPAEIAARFGDGAGWQAWALDQWMERLARNGDGATLAVLDAQVRPHAALEAMRRYGVVRGRAVLVDCDYAERNARLRGARRQPELATPDMDCFAAYMRGQADALGLSILDTTGRAESSCLDELRRHAEELLSATMDAADLTIRPIREGDENACRVCVVELQDAGREIDARLLPGEIMADGYLREMHARCAQHAGAIFVAERDGDIIGLVMVLAHIPFESLDEPPGGYALVAELVVRNGYRQRGTGAALLRAAERYARDAGASELRIAVLSRNHPARQLYLREGFAPYFDTLAKQLIDTSAETPQHDSR